jgi:hypothetical protein
MLGVFRSSFRQSQHEGEDRDDEGDSPAFFFGLNGGVGGFRHRSSPLWESAALL